MDAINALEAANAQIEALDAAIKAGSGLAAAHAAIKAAKLAAKMDHYTAAAIRAELRERMATHSGAPSVPGGTFGSYHRGKTAVYVGAFGAPGRFDVRIAQVVQVVEADRDRRSRAKAADEAPSPFGIWAFLAQ